MPPLSGAFTYVCWLLLHQPSLAVLQIRALEHQLSALRAQAADVEDRRTSLAQRKAAASKAAGAAGGAKAAAGVLGSGHYQVRDVWGILSHKPLAQWSAHKSRRRHALAHLQQSCQLVR